MGTSPLNLPEWSCLLNPVTSEGRLVRLELLTLDHEAELLCIAQNPEIWRFTTSEAGSPAAMRLYVETALHDYFAGVAVPFVVRLQRTCCLVGFTRLKNLSRQNRNAEVGSWFAPEAWGSGANAESKLLLLEYAFERLHCIRVEFQTDSRNLRSRNALAAIGAIEEGILRSRRITREGFRRDSVFFSILDNEWALVKRHLMGRVEAQLSRNRAGDITTQFGDFGVPQ